MYRDNTLIPTEAIRLAALGILEAGPRRYAELAREVRDFASRFTGPSLDLMGSSLELLRYEGLVDPVDGVGMEDNALLALTDFPVKKPTRLPSSIRVPPFCVSCRTVWIVARSSVPRLSPRSWNVLAPAISISLLH